ncbi:MAG: ATP-dependent RecD-like DNA helicase [Clostridiales Family XIII bacterium]|nr:ATP-dependent RecD-like DNA helicase [Clostridiales Family XIII bacterium]
METKTATISIVTYHNPENGYSVVRMSGSDGDFTAVGNLPNANSGQVYSLTGVWKTHAKYGRQFAFHAYEEKEPSSAQDIEAFLASGIIRGIGPKTARLIIEQFGESALEIIEKTPQRLAEVEGIGQKKWKTISASFQERKSFSTVALYFQEHGVATGVAMRFYNEYGPAAIEMVQENPYRLISDLYGIGFKTADAIALRLGHAENSEYRISSAVLYVLKRYATDGSTYVPKEELIERVVALIDVMGEEVEDAIFSLVLEGRVDTETVFGVSSVFLSYLFLAEREICADLLRLRRSELRLLKSDATLLIEETQRRMEKQLSVGQMEAVLSSLKSGVFVLTGGPGTGKTTIMRAMLDVFSGEGLEVTVAAPTGRAAKRITETTGYAAQTVHRLLEYSFGEDDEDMVFGRTRENPLKCDVVIIDEVSMADALLMRALVAAIPDGARLILVGDADQLPPVGPGNVLRDILESEVAPSAHLTEIFRQAEQSMITVNAHRINCGEMPYLGEADSDFFLLRVQEEEQILASIIRLITNRIPGHYKEIDPFKDIQVLTPVKKGVLGNRNLNLTLQNILNPQDMEKAEKQFGDVIFREGDKVMQMRNNYALKWVSDDDFSEGEGVFNGDIGFVSKVDEAFGLVTVVYDGSKLVVYDVETLHELEHAYAITVHKSQGSEFPVVLMPIYHIPPMLATRNLLYTAVTRGKRLVVLAGRSERLAMMVENNSSRERYSALKHFLRLYEGASL